jgi:O-methyltransferase
MSNPATMDLSNPSDLWEQLLAQLPDASARAAFVDFVAREVLPKDHNSVFWGDRLLSLDKSMGFLSDPVFARAWEQVRGAHIYDQYDNRQSIAWRMHTLVWAARHALALPEGDFVECGVFQGDMSHVVYHASGLARSGRRMHLFDSFEGIDPARVAPGEYRLSPNYVGQANAHYSRPDLYQSVCDRFATCPEISVHRGYLPEALQGRAPDSIAWLHIDLNAAIPEVQTLEVLFDRLVPSGIVILDDYGWLVLRGQKDAEDRVFRAPRLPGAWSCRQGQGMVVKRPRATATHRARWRHEPTRTAETINLDQYAHFFDGIVPWSGFVPGGFTGDFLGVRTAHEFLPLTNFAPAEKLDREVKTLCCRTSLTARHGLRRSIGSRPPARREASSRWSRSAPTMGPRPWVPSQRYACSIRCRASWSRSSRCRRTSAGPGGTCGKMGSTRSSIG